MQKVTIYTDGACSGNPGPGGWGAILIAGDNKKEISRSEQKIQLIILWNLPLLLKP